VLLVGFFMSTVVLAPRIPPTQGSQALPLPRESRRCRERRILIGSLMAADVLGLVLALATAAVLRFTLDGFVPVAAFGLPERHLIASVLVVPVLMLLFAWNGLYEPDAILVGSREYARIAHAVTYGVLLVLAASYFAGEGPLVARSWLLLLWMTSVLFTGFGRFGVRRVVRALRCRGILRTRVVVIGASSFGIAIAEQLAAARGEGLDVVGFLDEYLPLGQQLTDGVSVIGRPSDLLRGLANDLGEEYVLIPHALPHERLEEIMGLMVSRNWPTLRMAVSSRDLLTRGVLVTERAGIPLLTIRRARITGLDAILKRAFDILGASLALIVTAPVAVVTLTLMAVNGRRPRLTAQRVYGAGSETVKFWLLGSSSSGSPVLLGLPALLAVLSGKLSLVGPRPVPPGEEPPFWHHSGLTAVRPGVTGPWRLEGPQATPAAQAIRDLAYVRDYTIWEDLRSVWQTIRLQRAGLASWRVG
jgi:lipopolysaccharide/colanic/teichoic acid biosynthesis glycosyltransferase